MKKILNLSLVNSSTFLSLFLLAFLCHGTLQSSAQCTDPISIGSSTIIHANCPGNGQITVGTISPSAASIAPDYYQYALYDTSGTTVIAPYQSSNILINIDAGIYEIRVRKACASGFSSPISQIVTVNNTEQMAFINSFTLQSASQ